MVYSYKDLSEKGYSDYQIKRMVREKKLYLIKKGSYSTEQDFNYLEYIAKKHPNAIITLESACYCYGLLKEEKDFYRIATKQKDRKIHDEKVKQIFMTDSLYYIGIQTITYKGFQIKIYDLERLLIEVARNKIALSYDDYHEIMDSYRRISRLIKKEKLYEYMKFFKDEKVKQRIRKELAI